MARVYLVQLLCPSRHCIICGAYEEGKADGLSVIDGMIDRMREEGVNPWCGLCGSKKLFFEIGETRFQSLAEAMPELKLTEKANAMSAAALSQGGNPH